MVSPYWSSLNCLEGREFSSASPAQRAASGFTQARGVQQSRPTNLRLPLLLRPANTRSIYDCRAGNRYPLATSWLSLVLAVEVEPTSRQATSILRRSSADPEDEPPSPALGRSRISWRTPQAPHPCQPHAGSRFPGTAKPTSVPRLEN